MYYAVGLFANNWGSEMGSVYWLTHQTGLICSWGLHHFIYLYSITLIYKLGLLLLFFIFSYIFFFTVTNTPLMDLFAQPRKKAQPNCLMGQYGLLLELWPLLLDNYVSMTSSKHSCWKHNIFKIIWPLILQVAYVL